LRIFFILLLLIPLVFAMELPECKRTETNDNIPCVIPSSYRPSDGCLKEIDIYSGNGTLVQNSTYSDYIPNCKFVWNITTIDTYQYNSTIDTGVITVTKKDNMLAIIIAQIFIISFFTLIGFPHKLGFVKFFLWSMAMAELIMTIWFVYMLEANLDITPFLYINSIVALIIGGTFGLLSIYAMMVKLINPSNKKVVNDDDYTKYVLSGEKGTFKDKPF